MGFYYTPHWKALLGMRDLDYGPKKLSGLGFDDPVRSGNVNPSNGADNAKHAQTTRLYRNWVLSDEFEPVTARTMKLPFMPCPTDATQRERQRG